MNREVKLDPSLKRIGSVLRDRFGEVGQAPMPWRITELLRKLEAQVDPPRDKCGRAPARAGPGHGG
jgi:hypothetical protein